MLADEQQEVVDDVLIVLRPQGAGGLGLTGHALQSLTNGVTFADTGADSADTHTQTGTDCLTSDRDCSC